MSRPFAMYHKDYTGPEGRIFDEDEPSDPSREELARQGWVDNPAKHGMNPWGPGAQAKVDEIEQKFRDKKIGPLDEPGSYDEIVEGERLMREQAERERAEFEQRALNAEQRAAEAEAREKELVDEVVRRQNKEREGLHQVTGDVGETKDDPPPPDDPPELLPSDKIKAAMRELDRSNTEHVTRDGKFRTEVLEKMTGIEEITAAERDELQAAVEAEGQPDL